MKDLIIERERTPENETLRIVLDREDGVSFIEMNGYKIKGEGQRRYFNSICIELTKEEVKKIKDLLK